MRVEISYVSDDPGWPERETIVQKHDPGRHWGHEAGSDDRGQWQKSVVGASQEEVIYRDGKWQVSRFLGNEPIILEPGSGRVLFISHLESELGWLRAAADGEDGRNPADEIAARRSADGSWTVTGKLVHSPLAHPDDAEEAEGEPRWEELELLIGPDLAGV
jgi:hypothetical protein